MKQTTSLFLAALLVSLGFTSCADKPEKKPMGPATDTSMIPWNAPVAGHGQGQFGMMQQNQYRR